MELVRYLLDDVRIGAQSLVAAGSLLSPGTIIPPRSLVMGMPAKVKRPLTDEEVSGLDLYWQNYVAFTKLVQGRGMIQVFSTTPDRLGFVDLRDLFPPTHLRFETKRDMQHQEIKKIAVVETKS